ncbi:MAG TPA: hypothetical protein DEA08_04485 [Planctomycetes bacterium]|nr:hypothetical protein [Planctomycetota bacterium]
MTKVLHRSAYLRGTPDTEARVAEFVAATEAPVDTVYGREVLRMSGCDMSRYARNPVVLDSHRRESIEDVIGSGDVRVEGGQLIVRVHYLDDADGEKAWRKVKAGALRAVSIGYAIATDAATPSLVGRQPGR